MGALHNGNTPFPRRQPALPAFCRTRQRSVTVSVNGLSALRLLVLLGLLFQLSTLLLVIAGPLTAPPPIQTLPAAPLSAAESAAETSSLMPPERRVPQPSGER